MASRYDQPDAPDTDRYDDKPVDVQDIPAEGEPWRASLPFLQAAFNKINKEMDADLQSRLVDAGYRGLVAMDPAEHAAQSLTSALTDLEVEIAKVSDFDRAMALWKILRSLEQQVTRVAGLAGDKADAMNENPFS